MKKRRTLFLVFALCLSLLTACGGSGTGNMDGGGETREPGAEKQGRVILATTTSTKDSGLLEAILPAFTEATGWEVEVVPVGSGEAMAMGEAGEADVLLVHSPAAEEAFVAGGHADADGRMDVMYNDFVLIGPDADEVGILTAFPNDATAAFKAIAAAQHTFVSRADQSGTHKKEESIWQAAAIIPEGDWYVQAADGMGAVITMTNEMLGYTLSDRATWLNLEANTELKIVCEQDPSGMLNNQYGVICVNPDKNDQINAAGAKAFQEWIVSADGQTRIGEYGAEEYGTPLFTPDAR